MSSCNIDFKNLSEMFDEESLNTFISVYLDGKDPDFIQRREYMILKLLRGDELKNFKKTIEKVKEYVEKMERRKEFVRMVIFASEKYSLFTVIPLENNRRLNKSSDVSPEIKNKLVLDSSPYIRYLTEYLNEYREAYTLLLMSYEQAKIFSVSCGDIAKEKSISEHILNRHKKGGWSQARFQRIRKGEIKAFFSEVEEFLAGYGKEMESLILAGPGKAKTEFKNSLSSHLRKKVIGVIDVGIDDENLLIEESFDLIYRSREKEKEDILQQIKQEILKDGLAAYGLDETLEKVMNGQVELLMVDRNYHQNGWKCERCQILEKDRKGIRINCPICGNTMSEVDVIEEIIEYAGRMDTRVEFVETEDLKDLGSIVALLRYAT